MPKDTLKPCPECGKMFYPLKGRTCCTRKCYKRQLKKRKDSEPVTFPSHHCPKCGGYSTLAFEPLTDWVSWMSYKCPHCDWRVRDDKDIVGDLGIRYQIKYGE